MIEPGSGPGCRRRREVDAVPVACSHLDPITVTFLPQTIAGCWSWRLVDEAAFVVASPEAGAAR